MQITPLLALLGTIASLALANPVSTDAHVEVQDKSHLLRRDGVDFCPPLERRHAGDPCRFAGDNSAPHACGRDDRRAIVSCVLRNLV